MSLLSPASLSRRSALCMGLLALAGALAVSGGAQARKVDKQIFKISAGAAPEALAEFVRQSGFQVLFDFKAQSVKIGFHGDATLRNPLTLPQPRKEGKNSAPCHPGSLFLRLAKLK